VRRNHTLVAVVTATALLAGAVGIAIASPASGVTPTVLARGTYPAFKVISNPAGPGMYKAESKASIDMVVRQHAYLPGSSTGWHAHPFPVYITVVSGQVTFYDYDDPSCTPTVVKAGEGYVDSGHGHIGRNETGQPALDISVIMAPVGAAFRTELDAPGPFCGF
jgi:Cupin domain